MRHIKSELVNGDWERIYINGEVVLEGHAITARQLMWLIETHGIEIECTEVQEDDE